MPDLLLEIGLEEVPARMLAQAEAELLKRVTAVLEREQLLAGDAAAKSYSTPRRLAVVVRGALGQQQDITEEVTGPAVKIAYKDGVATPAAEAFAKKSGVAVSELKTVATPKGEYLAVTVVKKGRSAVEVLAELLPKEIAALYWAKNMRWIPGSSERFVRPVQWIACLLGDAVVPVEFGGKSAGRVSYGHRVHHGAESVTLTAPKDYAEQMEQAFVLVDAEERRHRIRKALDRVTRTVAGARWREDEPLVDTVTHLTEWPDVLLGSFEATYLELPEEVLVTVMRDHQKYFALEGADGKLLPHFLTVTNIALSKTNAEVIRHNNERVLRARFNDARFFWEFDQRMPLTERVKLLESVTFQKDLGSYAAKSERVRAVCARLLKSGAPVLEPPDEEAVMEAARLAKTDLTTELVKEFTELQGVIGGLYARSQGIRAVVADAIYDQYLPASSSDAIPRSAEGALLGLADRIDTIAGMFSLGMEPTGSKDPFALRRAANAVVRILAESRLTLMLSDVLNAASPQPPVAEKLTAFFAERVEFYLREVRGQSYDVVKAVMAAGYDNLRDAVARAEAVTAARGSADFVAVSAAFKRMKNILAQAEEKGITLPLAVDRSRLQDPTEVQLAETVRVVGMEYEALCRQAGYDDALKLIATLRPRVDAFFEAVMVMAPESDLRDNRLALLVRTVADFSRIADFSEIVAG